MSNLISSNHPLTSNRLAKLTTLIMTFILSSLVNGTDLESSNIKGYDFSIRDVQTYCVAKRASGDNLTVHCKDKRLKAVGQSCEGWITGGLDAAKFSCGGGLWVLNSRCKIEMRGASNGDVNCEF